MLRLKGYSISSKDHLTSKGYVNLDTCCLKNELMFISIMRSPNCG